MGRYLIRRFAELILTVFLIATATFFLLEAVPGDPLTQRADHLPEQTRTALYQRYGLDKPVMERYLITMKKMCKGDFGESFVYAGQTVTGLLKTKLPVSARLGIQQMLLGVTLGLLLGIVAAMKRGTWIDSALSTLMLVISSIPTFVLSILAILFLSKYVPGYSFIGTYSNTAEFISRISVPGIIMAVGLVATLGRVTRSSMISQLQAPYMITAKAKGLGKFNKTFKHAFHNAVIPVLTVAGYMFAGAIGSTVLIEQIFSLPGIGGMLVTGIQQNNYPIVQVLVLVMLVSYLIMSFVVDILYAVVDPRVEMK